MWVMCYFVFRREFEIQNLNSKIQDLESGQNQQRKKIKDLEVSTIIDPPIVYLPPS